MGEAALRIIEDEFEHHDEKAARVHIDDELVRTNVALKNVGELQKLLVDYNLKIRTIIGYLNQKKDLESYQKEEIKKELVASLEKLKGGTYQFEHCLEKINEWRKLAFKFSGPVLVEKAIGSIKKGKFEEAIENLNLLNKVIENLKKIVDSIKTYLSAYERNLKDLDKKEIWPQMLSVASSIEKFLDKIQKEVCDFI